MDALLSCEDLLERGRRDDAALAELLQLVDDELLGFLRHLPRLAPAILVLIRFLSGAVAEALQEIMSHKATPEEVLDYLSKWCLLNWDSEGSEWWAKVRPVYEKRNPTHLEVIATLMEVVR